ncbi:MAG: Mut7-C RNAse domain-containing protein [Elusimicrobia bacterium]|nr:Mut7-C RNAse domain-containing protein [Elusimicrobiota bacterium]
MPAPRFLSDRMLGKVARWLALLGYDSRRAGEGEIDDAVLMETARREGRVLLTRDTRMPTVAGLSVLVVRTQAFEDQLAEVLDAFGLRPDPGALFSRCTLCNEPLTEEPREAVLAEVPEKVRLVETRFFRCPSCRRLYWSGTHVERARALLARLDARRRA